MKERWKSIPSLPPYEASSAGRIRLGSVVLQPRPDRRGHLVLSVKIRDYYSTRRVARMVGEAFGVLDVSKGQWLKVVHQDGDLLNCCPANLACISSPEAWLVYAHNKQSESQK